MNRARAAMTVVGWCAFILLFASTRANAALPADCGTCCACAGGQGGVSCFLCDTNGDSQLNFADVLIACSTVPPDQLCSTCPQFYPCTPTPTLTSAAAAPTPTETAPASPTATSTSAPTPTPTPTPTATAIANSCVGDCNNDSQVTVDELLTMINIALGNADVSTCLVGDPNHNMHVTIDEILTAVNNALNGCAGPPPGNRTFSLSTASSFFTSLPPTVEGRHADGHIGPCRGILTLVGAPIPYTDHAPRAVGMALQMRERGRQVLSRWQKLGLDLGLGVGIASGYVTVGALGGEKRLEYAAVGPPVNLAARLCALADSGQILTDQRTVGLISENGHAYRFDKREPVTLKGFTRPVTVFAVSG